MKTLIVFSTPRCALLCSQPQSGMKKCFITSRYWNHRLFFSIITVDYSFKPYIICLKLSQPLPTCTKVSSYSKWPTCTKVSSYNYFLFQCLYNIIEYTVNFCVVPGHYFGFYKMCIISMSEIVYISNHILSGLPTTGCKPKLVIGLGVGILLPTLLEQEPLLLSSCATITLPGVQICDLYILYYHTTDWCTHCRSQRGVHWLQGPYH